MPPAGPGSGESAWLTTRSADCAKAAPAHRPPISKSHRARCAGVLPCFAAGLGSPFAAWPPLPQHFHHFEAILFSPMLLIRRFVHLVRCALPTSGGCVHTVHTVLSRGLESSLWRIQKVHATHLLTICRVLAPCDVDQNGWQRRRWREPRSARTALQSLRVNDYVNSAFPFV